MNSYYSNLYSKELVFGFLLTYGNQKHIVTKVLRIGRTFRGVLYCIYQYHLVGKDYLYKGVFVFNKTMEDALATRAMKHLVEKSQKVTFLSSGHTTNNWHCSLVSCNCPSYSDPNYGLKLNGVRICKHTIAYAKKYVGLNSIHQFADRLNQIMGVN